MEKSSLSYQLIKKAESVKKAAEQIAEITMDWQIIRSYMNNRLTDIVLNERQEKKMGRYKYIYDQLASGKYSDLEIVNQLMNKKLYGVSMKQAYDDMKCSKELFFKLMDVDKLFELKLELQLNRTLINKCIENGDMDGAAKFEKNRISLLKELPEPEDIAGDMFEGHIIEAVFDPRLLGNPDVDVKEILQLINDKRKVKLNIDQFTTDIPFEDVPNAEETTSL